MGDDLRAGAVACRLRIAIDGPAGAGKSTVGREIAERLGCQYIDTGLMYRAVTWQALEREVPLDDHGRLVALGRSLSFRFGAGAGGCFLVDGIDPGADLRTPAVDAHVSMVSAVSAVRAVLVEHQRALAEAGCTVMVGRDIGTVVLPDAPVKLWITASAEERARRRLRDKREDGVNASLATLVEELRRRDRYDEERPVSPQRPAAGALVLVTDNQSRGQVVAQAMAAIRRTLAIETCASDLDAPGPIVPERRDKRSTNT